MPYLWLHNKVAIYIGISLFVTGIELGDEIKYANDKGLTLIIALALTPFTIPLMIWLRIVSFCEKYLLFRRVMFWWELNIQRKYDDLSKEDLSFFKNSKQEKPKTKWQKNFNNEIDRILKRNHYNENRT